MSAVVMCFPGEHRSKIVLDMKDGGNLNDSKNILSFELFFFFFW